MYPKYPESTAETPDLTLYQLFCLKRLQKLLELQQKQEAPHRAPWMEQALSKVIYSVFLDCVEAGVEGEARKLVKTSCAEHARTASASV